MFDELASGDVFTLSGSLEALRDLENNTHDAFVAQRSSERVEIRTLVIVKHGNPSQRHLFSAEGLTADISSGGCMVLLPRPLLAGDLFFLTFDKRELRLGPQLARCMRCRMVQEDTYETGFRFLQDVDLSDALVS